MAFFTQMGNVWFTLEDGSKVLINDITTFARIEERWNTDARVQMAYKIKDGELPHMISNRLYGSVEYWWTILKLNNIFDYDNQWPRSTKQLYEYIERKYPEQDRSDLHHYIDPNGLVADLLSLRIEYGLEDDEEVIDRAGLEKVSIEEYEMAVNELKRDIILIDPDYIGSVQTEYDKAMET
jgi:hypothetical protein